MSHTLALAGLTVAVTVAALAIEVAYALLYVWMRRRAERGTP